MDEEEMMMIYTSSSYSDDEDMDECDNEDENAHGEENMVSSYPFAYTPQLILR